jgi:hypothetical protein
MFQILFQLLSCINTVFVTYMPARGLARTVYSGIPDDAILSISFSASAAGQAFILTGADNKITSSETESTAMLALALPRSDQIKQIFGFDKK